MNDREKKWALVLLMNGRCEIWSEHVNNGAVSSAKFVYLKKDPNLTLVKLPLDVAHRVCME